MEPHILYQDNDLLLVEKPSGMIVNRADTSKGVVTLQDWVDEKFPVSNFRAREKRTERHIESPKSDEHVVAGYNKYDEYISRSGIVHRLDKETSGVIIVALNVETFIAMQNQFKDGIVKKTYQALLHGKLTPMEGEINEPIGRLPWNRMRFGVLKEGRPAKTSYKVPGYLESGEGKNKEEYSLVEVYPQTGRTHQIRVHFQHIGYPVVSDALYAGRKRGRRSRQKLSRHFLHASSITFK
ncbi:MAG: RluA family pseudouridine synthase, partial [Candidatus Levyibacteriota bacterium]